jgi:Holliday junction DNA helicase RuvA
MIGQLTGLLIEKNPPELLIDVQGVGYELYAPMTTFYQLPDEVSRSADANPSKPLISLYTHMVVREDVQQLYGFYHRADRQLFRELIKVSGIGPKLALTILSGMDSVTFVQSIRHQDTALLTSLPGLGKKTAERLIIEMQDRLKNWSYHQSAPDGNAVATVINMQLTESRQPLNDAQQALIALGYKPQHAHQVLNAMQGADELSCEQLIRGALKVMMK